jgi:hypothetical protein
VFHSSIASHSLLRLLEKKSANSWPVENSHHYVERPIPVFPSSGRAHGARSLSGHRSLFYELPYGTPRVMQTPSPADSV